MYTHMHTDTRHTHMPTCVHTAQTYPRIRTNTFMYIYTYPSVHTCLHVYTLCTQMQAYPHMHTSTLTCMHSHLHIPSQDILYTHLHTHIHECADTYFPGPERLGSYLPQTLPTTLGWEIHTGPSGCASSCQEIWRGHGWSRRGGTHTACVEQTGKEG